MNSEFVILENSQIVSNANQGRGGNINIEAEVFLADPDSVVSAIALNSEVGINGEVNVEAVVTNLSDVVTPLPPDFASAASLLRDRCAAQLQEGTVSSLVARGLPVSLPPLKTSCPAGSTSQAKRLLTCPRLSGHPQRPSATAGDVCGGPFDVATDIHSPFPAHDPVVLKCDWIKP